MKLNLGCGEKKLAGWVNLDGHAAFAPDILHDLETVPWPVETGSCEEILLNHVLEHVGESSATFLAIMQELYRIARPDALLRINVPHPRHDDFINDPTHVRPITPEMLALFDLDQNHAWIRQGAANSKLAIATGTNFRIVEMVVRPDARFLGKDGQPTVSLEDLVRLAKRELNVIREYRIVLKAVK